MNKIYIKQISAGILVASIWAAIMIVGILLLYPLIKSKPKPIVVSNESIICIYPEKKMMESIIEVWKEGDEAIIDGSTYIMTPEGTIQEK